MTSILLLHGALGSSDEFSALAQELPCACVTMDFIGHGTTPDDEAPWTIDRFASQLETFIEELPKPLPIFGYSMGGYVALWLSLR